VLSRKTGQKLIVTIPPCDTEREIVVMLCDIRDNGGKARIGIEADTSISIMRAELLALTEHTKEGDE